MSGYKLAAGIRSSEYMDGVPFFRDLPVQTGLPARYQPGGDLYGLRTDHAWTDPSPPYTYFREAEEIIEAGDRTLVGHGAPAAQWFFPVWTTAQLAYVRAEFCAAPALSAVATIRTLQPDGVWGDWYGVMHFPQPGQDMTRTSGGWLDVLLKFYGLRRAPATEGS